MAGNELAVTWPGICRGVADGYRGVKQRRAYAFGLDAEQIAALMLRQKGYLILAKRFKTPYGEIDLVACRKGVVVFVEVKGRSDLVSAAWALTPRQQRRIVTAAEFWRTRQSFDRREFGKGEPDYRFDAVLIAPRQRPHHIKNAFFSS